MPFFSIVIPVKDRSQLLFRALASLRLQAFDDFEVIVVDDNSTEDISIVVNAFQDLRVRLVRQASSKAGACAARNLGGDLAEGRYIAYLDSDDIFLPAKLARFAERIRASGSALLASFLVVYRGDPRLQIRPARPPSHDERIDEFFYVYDQRIQSSSIVIAREHSMRIRWNESLRKVQDSDFFIRAFQSVGTVDFIPEPLAVLFDDQLQGRISNRSAEENMLAWLASDACPLSERAKAGFRFYALSHEIGKRSKIDALGMMMANRRAVGLKIQLKSLYRMLVPEYVFKKTAILLRGNGSGHSSDVLSAIRHLEGLSATAGKST